MNAHSVYSICVALTKRNSFRMHCTQTHTHIQIKHLFFAPTDDYYCIIVLNLNVGRCWRASGNMLFRAIIIEIVAIIIVLSTARNGYGYIVYMGMVWDFGMLAARISFHSSYFALVGNLLSAVSRATTTFFGCSHF